MKTLFVSSGNSSNGISPIVKNQGESLHEIGVEVDYFTIVGKGFFGYLKNIKVLKDILKNKYDIVHAHYSLSAFVASLAGSKPLVVSLMGSDVKARFWFKFIISIFNYFFWNAVIVKSDDMYNSLGIKKAVVVPNGVDLNHFKVFSRNESVDKLGWNKDKINILFAANPSRPEKNYTLTQKGVELLHNENVDLHVLDNVQYNEMPLYYNASDIVILTSLWEGSPNVIKEAMACNCVIISTDVGDVKQRFADSKGLFITDFDSNDLKEKLISAINFGSKSSARVHVLNLDRKEIAKKILKIYEQNRII